jgi:hypothetical protein
MVKKGRTIWRFLSLQRNEFGPSILTHDQIGLLLRRAVPGMPDATIRSHLFSLKRRGALQKSGNRWRLSGQELSATGQEA